MMSQKGGRTNTGVPTKKAPADLLRKTERVHGRRTARQEGLTQPGIPMYLFNKMGRN